MHRYFFPDIFDFLEGAFLWGGGGDVILQLQQIQCLFRVAFSGGYYCHSNN